METDKTRMGQIPALDALNSIRDNGFAASVTNPCAHVTRQSILTVPPESWVFRPVAEFKAQANLGNFVVYKRGARGPVKRSGKQFAEMGGFTLLELLVVGAVVAVLLGVAVGALRGARQRALVLQARAGLAALSQSLADYRRTWGEYPCTGDWPQAEPELDEASRIAVSSAQSKLFNALAGVYGPGALRAADARRGRVFLDAARFHLEASLDKPDAWPVAAVGDPPHEVANALVDPWGRRYLYFYKPAPTSGASPWKAPTYVLFSAGPDGAYALPQSWSGIVDDSVAAISAEGELINADNLYAPTQ